MLYIVFAYKCYMLADHTSTKRIETVNPEAFRRMKRLANVRDSGGVHIRHPLQVRLLFGAVSRNLRKGMVVGYNVKKFDKYVNKYYQET